MGTAGAEGHANAHFMIALGYGEGHDAIYADRGEGEREYGEGAEDENGEAVGDEGFTDDLVHGADTRHGEIGIDGTDGGGDAGCDGAGISVGADSHGGEGPGALVKRKVNFGRGCGAGVAFVLDVVEDANDLPLDRWAEGRILVGDKLEDFDALGEGIESGEVLAGEGFADHGDARSAGEISGIEIAAAGEADAVRCVIAWRDGVNHRLRFFIGVVVGVIGGLTGDGEMESARAVGGKAGGYGDFHDSGNGGDSLFELAVDGADLGGARGALVLDGDAEGEDVVAANAEVDLGDVPEAVENEARTGDEDECEGELGDDEYTAETVLAGAY